MFVWMLTRLSAACARASIVPQEERKYIMSFYIQGIIAIITQWLKDDCKEEIEFVMQVIQRCIKQPKGNL